MTTETSVVRVCAVRGVHWYEGEASPPCTDATHEHGRVEVHRHRSLVVLPDGSPITAVSFDPLDPYGRETPPDFGLYLDRRWAPPWPHTHVEWPDFGVPGDAAELVRALRSLHDRTRAGERVEIGCLGGHGRTGTALACLAILGGHPAADAVTWVRTAYCADAVETPEQETFVVELAELLR